MHAWLSHTLAVHGTVVGNHPPGQALIHLGVEFVNNYSLILPLEIDSHDNATHLPPLTKCIESAHMQCKPTHKELKLWVVVVVVLCCYQCTCRHLI